MTILVLLVAALLPAKTDPPGEQAINGSITAIEQHTCKDCNCTEVTLVLKTDKGRLWVKLGPRSYLEQRDFALFRGDIVEVKGFRFKEDGKWTMFANEIRKGGDTLILRGKYGKPEWLEKHSHTCPVCGN